MPSYKSDSSFFHKIAVGAIGSRIVTEDLTRRGHKIVELERGSLDAKIWKGVKRKRVRIPDLVCLRCGQRIEVRTKSEPKLSMSHSLTISERCWDYGMVGEDLIATPICVEQTLEAGDKNSHWMRGALTRDTSYWNEKEWVKWCPDGTTNYFTVNAFRNASPDKTEKKGADEGSETTLIWRSCFSPCEGTVTKITDANIAVMALKDGTLQRRGHRGMQDRVAVGALVLRNQILACNVEPASGARLQCAGELSDQDIIALLGSRHLPVRFAGVKIARMCEKTNLEHQIAMIANNRDEDIYIRLEAKAYLAKVHQRSLSDLFIEELSAHDKPDQLEAVIAIGEVGTEEAAVILANILGDPGKEYFLRSGAAYCLGRIDSPVSRAALVDAFTARSHRVREDALAALIGVGFKAMAELVSGINNGDEQVQAGCAEAIRWLAIRSDTATVESEIVPEIARILEPEDRSLLSVWLGGQLSEPLMRAAIDKVLVKDARLAYSLFVSWAFARSWIAPIHDAFQQPRL